MLIITLKINNMLPNKDLHQNIMLQILKDIYTDKLLGPILGFKGGTAAYFFHDLNRFSTDLDFDLLDKNKEKEVLEKIENIAREYGTIKEKLNKNNTIFILLSYNKKEHNIKIEINKRNFNSQYEVKNFLGISMLVIKQKDMFAHKLVAMLERKKTANRDIYDVWFFMKNNWSINKKIIEQRTEMSFVKYIKKCIQFIEKVSDKHILSGLGEILDEKQKQWVKSNLKKDVLFLLKLRIKNSN